VEHQHAVAGGAHLAPPHRVAVRRVKPRGVDAAPPQGRLTDAAPLQLVHHGYAGRVRHAGRPVEPGEPAPHDAGERRHAVVAAIAREVGVERRHQRDVAPQGVAPADQRQGPFRGDVHEVGAEPVEEGGHAAGHRGREPNVVVRRKRQRRDAQLVGRATPIHPGVERGDHGRDPVDLGRVGVAHQRDPHGWNPGRTASSFRDVCVTER
jgi:hypothetical protein